MHNYKNFKLVCVNLKKSKSFEPFELKIWYDKQSTLKIVCLVYLVVLQLQNVAGYSNFKYFILTNLILINYLFYIIYISYN